MYFVFIGILALRYRKYQGCDILSSVILVTCTWVCLLYLPNLPYRYFLWFLCTVRIFCACTFLLVQLMFCQDTLYCDTRSFWCSPLPIPPEVVFVGKNVFAFERGGCVQKIKNIYAQPHHMYKCNGGGCVNTFLLWFITSTVSNVYR